MKLVSEREIEAHAIQFINAYQERHQLLLNAGKLGAHQDYWVWRGGWITECLRRAPVWARDQGTLQAFSKYQGVGHPHVEKTYNSMSGF